MDELFAEIRGAAAEARKQEAELRQYFVELEHQHREVAGGFPVRCVSSEYTFTPGSADDWGHGHLYFGSHGFSVQYRNSREDENCDFYFEGEPAYHSKDLAQCRREWLLDLASPRIIKSLLSNITTTLNYDVMLTKAGVEKLKETSNLPFRDVDAGLVSVAKDLRLLDRH